MYTTKSNTNTINTKIDDGNVYTMWWQFFKCYVFVNFVERKFPIISSVFLFFFSFRRLFLQVFIFFTVFFYEYFIVLWQSTFTFTSNTSHCTTKFLKLIVYIRINQWIEDREKGSGEKKIEFFIYRFLNSFYWHSIASSSRPTSCFP